MGFGLSKCGPYREAVLFQEDPSSFSRDFWVPALEVEETKEEILVKAQLPGLKREEIQLQIQGDALVISGERKSETETKEKTVHLVETAYGKFQRIIGLPAEVDGTRATAVYEAGVLTVRLPKSEQAKPKEINVVVK